jgi:uncharacterized membrane protein
MNVALPFPSGFGQDGIDMKTKTHFWHALMLASWTCLFALGVTHSAAALTVGDQASGQIEVGAKQVPLPDGKWVVAGIGTQKLNMPAIGAFGSIQSVILLLPRDNQIVAVLEIAANTIQVNDGWGRTQACEPNRGQLSLIVRYRTGWETSCQFVIPTRFDLNTAGQPAWNAARAYAAKSKLTVPGGVWLTAGFRVSDRQDLVDARYHISPALLAGSAAAKIADWSADAVKADPVRQAPVAALAKWASGFDPLIERGMRNRLAEAPIPLPEANTSAPAYQNVKLAELRRLRDANRISEAVYKEQVAKANEEVPTYKPPVGLLSDSVYKNISFRTLGTFVDFGIAYFVTATGGLSWAIALGLNASDSVWFVLNDQYWDDYYTRYDTHDSERTVDFAYLGAEASGI